jgi:hypothetical protein
MIRRIYPNDPMTLGNMHESGVRSLGVSCRICHHQAVLNADLCLMTSRYPHSARVWCAPAAASSAVMHDRN